MPPFRENYDSEQPTTHRYKTITSEEDVEEKKVDEIEEIEQVETDEAKEQEKEQSVNACWGSNDYIHFGLFVVELLKLFDCRIETFL